MGCRIFAPGRRELLAHQRELVAAAQDSGTTVLCGNLGGRRPAEIRPWKSFRRHHRRILVTALVAPPAAATPIDNACKLLEPSQCLRRILKQPHDLAVAVFHMPEKQAHRLLLQVPGVNLAILVDKRGILAQGEKIGNTLLLRNNNRGKSIGVVEWDWRERAPERVWSLRADCQRFKPDPEIAKLVDHFEKWRREFYNRKSTTRKKPARRLPSLPQTPPAGPPSADRHHPAGQRPSGAAKTGVER